MVITQGVASRVVRPSQSSAPGSGVDPPEMPESPAVDVSSRLATWFGPVATLPAVLTSPLWAIRDHLLHPESIYIPPVLVRKKRSSSSPQHHRPLSVPPKTTQFRKLDQHTSPKPTSTGPCPSPGPPPGRARVTCLLPWAIPPDPRPRSPPPAQPGCNPATNKHCIHKIAVHHLNISSPSLITFGDIITIPPHSRPFQVCP